MSRVYLMLPLVFCTLWHPATAQQPAQAAPACADAAYRQFDFWVGEWEVRTPDGTLAGANSIRRILDGCALEENWRGARGSVGTSYNAYDAGTGRWHQTWVDASGLLLLLDGGLRDGAMVLEGETRGPSGRTRHRITWTPREDGTVRQFWESAAEGGEWQVAFDGIYKRK